jgi:DNA-binding NarL/FixJ family response regulator
MAEVLVVCGDLIFATKIRGTAETLGIPIRSSASGEDLAPDAAVRRVLIDLNAAGTSRTDLTALRQSFPAPCELIAFGSHVDVARLKEAREVGCDLVLPRSAFVERLSSLLNTSAALP